MVSYRSIVNLFTETYPIISPSTMFRVLFNISPMYRRTTAKVIWVSNDLHHVQIKIPFNYRNRNFVNTMFGGSQLSATDPILMVQLLQILNNNNNNSKGVSSKEEKGQEQNEQQKEHDDEEYVVWDKGVEFRFIRPVTTSLVVDFTWTHDEIQHIKDLVKQNNGELSSYRKTIQLKTMSNDNDDDDDSGIVCSESIKIMYIATKRHYNEKQRLRKQKKNKQNKQDKDTMSKNTNSFRSLFMASTLLSSSSSSLLSSLSSLSFVLPCTSFSWSGGGGRNRLYHQHRQQQQQLYPQSLYHQKQSHRLFSVSAYSGIPSDGTSGTQVLKLPLRARIPMPTTTSTKTTTTTTTTTPTTTRLVEIDIFRTLEEIEQGRQLMNDVIIEGKSWPFEEIFDTTETFQGYFLSHAAFCVRPVLVDDEGEDDDQENNNNNQQQILGCFYIKPNFPGRCSHICNGGFIVDPSQRGSKIGLLMGSTFLTFAHQLGYKSSYFNLVFASNTASVRLWESLKFQRVATIPNAARLEGMPPVVDATTSNETQLDIAYGYYYDLETLSNDYNPLRHPNLNVDFTP